jgi:hypothetical protein
MSNRRICWWLSACLSVAVVMSLGAPVVAQPRRGGTSAFMVVEKELRSLGEQRRVTVKGEGGGVLQLEGFEGDIVRFRINAFSRSDDPFGAEGTFEVTHVRPDGTVVADFAGSVNCMLEGADVAIATGIITSGGLPAHPNEEIVGSQVGLTVADHGRRDHVGWSWLVTAFEDVSTCASTAPFFPLSTGNFKVDAR